MGYVDTGGGPTAAAGRDGRDARDGARAQRRHARRPATAPADVRVTLVARKEQHAPRVRPGGRRLHAQRHLPRPADHARSRASWSRCTLRQRRRCPTGVTLHWHGVDVPNAEDGIAGVTQDAVMPGGEFVYRFVRRTPGTLLVPLPPGLARRRCSAGCSARWSSRRATPAAGVGRARARCTRTPARRPSTARRATCPSTARAGQPVRVRVVNTDSGPDRGCGRPARVPVARRRRPRRERADAGERPSVVVTAGGRVDLEVTAPPRVGVRVGSSGTGDRARRATAAAAGRPTPPSTCCPTARPRRSASTRRTADRSFSYSIGRRPGFVDGKPGLWWTINGHLFPDVPMFVVSEGDVVTMHIDEQQRRGAPHAPARPPRRRAGPRRRGGDRQPVVVRLPQRRRTARPTTSRSSPTTRASGWTTATTCSTPPTGSSRTSCTRGSTRPTWSEEPRKTTPSSRVADREHALA